MRKLVVVMMSTLNNRIANAQGTFWEPFHWGEPEVAYVNQFYRAADTWALSRVLYDVIDRTLPCPSSARLAAARSSRTLH